MCTSITAATKLLESISNGGGTVWLKGTEYSTGYVVALSGYEMRLSLEMVTAKVLQFYVENLVSYLADGVGVWVDNGFVYIDSVVHQENRQYAIDFGRYEKQLAIYDLTNATVIDL
jgi:hypothetical protein